MLLIIVSSLMLGSITSYDVAAQIVVNDDVLLRLTDATDQTIWELTRLLANHPAGQNDVIKAEMILFDHRKRIILADTHLQQIAINLDTSSRLMELLCLAVGGKNQTLAHINAIRDDRIENDRMAENITVEIRNNAYRNLVLWEMLSRFNVTPYQEK